jgi:hypothetical protein
MRMGHRKSVMGVWVHGFRLGHFVFSSPFCGLTLELFHGLHVLVQIILILLEYARGWQQSCICVWPPTGRQIDPGVFWGIHFLFSVFILSCCLAAKQEAFLEAAPGRYSHTVTHEEGEIRDYQGQDFPKLWLWEPCQAHLISIFRD